MPRAAVTVAGVASIANARVRTVLLLVVVIIVNWSVLIMDIVVVVGMVRADIGTANTAKDNINIVSVITVDIINIIVIAILDVITVVVVVVVVVRWPQAGHRCCGRG